MSAINLVRSNNTPAGSGPRIPGVNITTPAFHANPFAFYKQLRDEAPVHPMTLPDKRTAWLVTRYDDANALLRDDRFVKKPGNVLLPPGEAPIKEGWMPGFLRLLQNNMLDLDGADHDRLRALVHHAFTPKLVEQMRGQIESITNQLISKALAAGQFDLVRDFALPLPVAVISSMLGVPEGERDQFSHWSHTTVSATNNFEMLLGIPNLWRFMRYIRHLVILRRAQPADDLITALLQAREAGDNLSEDEIVAMIFLLLVAGHETTVTLISSSMLALLQHPEQRQQLQRDPALIKSAVEELLRFTTPVALGTERYAREDIAIAGVTIPKGSLAYAVLSSANRDERRFDEPDLLNLQREDNRHLGFGQGVHYCLGAPLARMEAQIAINTLLARIPNLRLAVAPDKLRWRKSLVIRGLEALSVDCTV